MSKARMFPRTTEQVLCSIWTSPALLHSGPGPQCSRHVGDLFLWKQAEIQPTFPEPYTRPRDSRDCPRSLCGVLKLCPTLCDPVDCSPPGSCLWNFPGKNSGAGCHFLLQGFFLTQGWNLSPAPPAFAGGFFTICTTWETPHLTSSGVPRHEAAVLIVLYLSLQFKSWFKI